MSMSVDIKIKDVKPMTVAFLSQKGHFNQIPDAFNSLYSWINQRGYKPHGPAIAVYYDLPGQVPDDQLRWEVRSQLSEDIAVTGPDESGLGIKITEAVRVATTIYTGPYEQTEVVYQALLSWIAENNYEINGPIEELYFNDPSDIPAKEPVVEIRIPVSKASD